VRVCVYYFFKAWGRARLLRISPQLVVHLCTRMVPNEGVGEDSNTHHPMDMST
jgi:hypothetical protein